MHFEFDFDDIFFFFVKARTYLKYFIKENELDLRYVSA